MSSSFLWVKVFHIVFVTSWFAGLFYLPRIFVNLAMAMPPGAEESKPEYARAKLAERARLLLMGRKLYRFMGPLMVLALGFGLWLWLGYGIGAGSYWLPLKLLIVAGLVAYHFFCGKILRYFEQGNNHYNHVWFRWFNEVPVLGLFVCVVLVVIKPF